MATGPAIELVTDVPPLSSRAADGNKGIYGRILVVAGSRGMTGAAILSASAALRGGAGLVRVAVPSGSMPIVASGNPCYMTVALPEDAEGRIAAAAIAPLLAQAEGNDVIAVGPGLGQSDDVTAVVSALVSQTLKSMVLDADGLNAVRHHPERLRNRAAPLVLTPHPGEFARLIGSDIATVQADREALATRFASENGLILVLKGHQTLVTDGRRLYRNTTGNPGMATGGTGDVLTGLIAALLGQKLEPFAAAQRGVFWHGRAGDLARDDLGEVCLIAADLLTYLPRALK